MSFFWHGFTSAVHLILHGDPVLYHLIKVTLEVAVISTVAALVLGLPIGLALGLERFRGSRLLLAVANAGLGLPPVVVGIFLTVLMFPAAPLGGLHILFTMRAIYLAQTILALPIVIALTAAAVRSVPVGLLDQARAFGAGRRHLYGLALREARIGVLAAAIAAVGSTLSEVGAVVLVGGNFINQTQTLAAAALTDIGGGDYVHAMAIGIVLIGLLLLVTAGLSFAQQRGGATIRLRAPS